MWCALHIQRVSCVFVCVWTLMLAIDPSTWFSGHSHFSSNPLHSISCHLRQTCSGNTWSGLHHLRLLASLHTGIYTEKRTVNLEAASYASIVTHIIIWYTHTIYAHTHTHTGLVVLLCPPVVVGVCGFSPVQASSLAEHFSSQRAR